MNDEGTIRNLYRQLEASLPSNRSIVDQILSVADTLHQEIFEWQLQQGIEPEDVAVTLDQLRQELDIGPDDSR
jgi:hypothetical protein